MTVKKTEIKTIYNRGKKPVKATQLPNLEKERERDSKKDIQN